MISVSPIKSMDVEIRQLNNFLDDLKELYSDEYINDFKDLRDETDRLRSKYSILYAKILIDKLE